jgi:hypothetical protein
MLNERIGLVYNFGAARADSKKLMTAAARTRKMFRVMPSSGRRQNCTAPPNESAGTVLFRAPHSALSGVGKAKQLTCPVKAFWSESGLISLCDIGYTFRDWPVCRKNLYASSL